MSKFTKLAITAGAVGVLGAAGSFGTYAAMTGGPNSQDYVVGSGDVKVTQSTFSLDNAQKFLTRSGEHAGSITVQNVGDGPINVYMDFDGPSQGAPPPGYPHSDNVLAENLQFDTSYLSDFGGKHFGDADYAGGPPKTGSNWPLMHQATRLWVMNRAGYLPLPDPDGSVDSNGNRDLLVLQPNEHRTIHFRGKLRSAGSDLLDQSLENIQITERIRVAAIEAGAVPDGTVFSTANDNGAYDE